MKLKNDHIDFELEIKKRGIECLIHFTPTLNLYSILEQKKVMSRSALESIDIDQYDILDYVKFTDNIRYDDKRYINLSISSPNTFLFSKFIKKTFNDMTIKWCVLKINPKHIYDSDTLFAVTNAASSAAKNQYGISGDIEIFKMLFAKQLKLNTFNGTRNISRNNILARYPTDIQAEVLVKNSIPVSSIISVCFQTNNDLAETKSAMCEFDTKKFIVEPTIFSPSRDI
jgi:hypothetical protein